MAVQLTQAQIIGIVVGVVVFVALVVGLAVGISVGMSSPRPTTSGEFVPTRTTFLVANTVTGSGVFPANIQGSYQAFLKQITYNTTNPNNVVWFLTNNLANDFVGAMIGTQWNYLTPAANNKMLARPLAASGGSRTVDLAVTGFGFSPNTSLPLDDLIPVCLSTVVTLTAGSGTVEIALPISLPTATTNYVVFAQNADVVAQPTLIISAATVATTNFIRIRHLEAAAGAARINYVICAINTFANFTNGVVYADLLANQSISSGTGALTVTLKNQGVPMLGNDPLWIGISADTSNGNVYVTGINQTSDTSIDLKASVAVTTTFALSLICVRGIAGSFFTVSST